MKKLLVMLLALVFVISMATAAYAYTDTDDLSTVQQDAIYRLTALGVFNGYPNGTFGAENLITRAEFAKNHLCCGRFGGCQQHYGKYPFQLLRRRCRFMVYRIY